MRRFIALLNLVFSTIFLSIIALIISPFDRSGEKINKIGRLWALLHLKICSIKVYVEGYENITGPPYIFMSNHQSVLDIFAILYSFKLPFKWIAKKELFSVPFLGWALKTGKNISIDRKRPRRAKKSMDRAAIVVKDSASIVIFPEGTWNKDYKLLPFKGGGFSLAMKTGVPIVPVGIKGTGELQPEGCFVPKNRGKITVKIGKPIYTEKKYTDKSSLALEVRFQIERLIQ